jgi:transposase-like protein
MWSVEPLVLTEEERAGLERRVRAQTTPHRERQRARVVLLAVGGVTGREIAKEVGLSPQPVSKWRIGFRDHGRSGLEDAERSGRPLVYGPTDRLVLMAKVTSELPEFSSQWSHFELADAMAAELLGRTFTRHSGAHRTRLSRRGRGQHHRRTRKSPSVEPRRGSKP